MNRTRAAVVALLVLAMPACSSAEGEGSSDGETAASSAANSNAEVEGAAEGESGADAAAVADELKSASLTATKVVTITEENDPNDLIGRPNGYESAAVVYDSEVTCDSLGSDCGVAIEVFADEASATARAEYIQTILKDAPALGSEWDYVKGSVLVRISGDLKPSSATNYAEAFGGEEVTVAAE